MNDVVKVSKLNYLYSAIASVIFVVIIAVFSEKMDVTSSYIPFLLIAAYDIFNIILVRRASPRECFKLFMMSVLIVFGIYKIITVFGIVNTFNDDGFFADYESNFYFIFDIMMVVNMVSTFFFLVFMRFMLSRQSIKNISKISVKRFVICTVILCFLAIGDLLLWNMAKPYEDKFLEYVSTYSPEKWEKYPSKRIDMFEDFEKSNDLHGMKKEDVEKILGEPELDEGYEMGFDKNGHNVLAIVYKDGTVAEYKIIQIKKKEQ